jgi:acyl-CoA thioester hydrolase
MNRPSLHFKVESSWIDLYGHMTASRYFELMESRGFVLYDRYGIGPTYTETENAGVYTVESRICFHRELKEDEEIELNMRLLDFDEKRVLVLYELYRHHGAEIVSTMEQLGVHVDLSTRKAAPFPSSLSRTLRSMLQNDQTISLPNGFIGPISIREWKRR